jgi:hypothetical protein
MSPPETARQAFGAWLAAVGDGELAGLVPVYRRLLESVTENGGTDRRLAENRWRLEAVAREIKRREMSA